MHGNPLTQCRGFNLKGNYNISALTTGQIFHRESPCTSVLYSLLELIMFYYVMAYRKPAVDNHTAVVLELCQLTGTGQVIKAGR